MEMAFARRLKDVVPRLELLGFTLEAAKTDTSVSSKRTGRNPTTSATTV